MAQRSPSEEGEAPLRSAGSQTRIRIQVVLEEAPEGAHVNMGWALYGCLAASPHPVTSTPSSAMS